MADLSDFTANLLGGGSVALKGFVGKVVLVVNVASMCGHTPQYEGLEALYREMGPRGLIVLGFPCNQFGAQEPGTDEEIASFCTVNYGVTFPMMGKVEVNGPGAHPLYRWLKLETPGSGNEAIEWNFAKFLIGRDGKPIKRFASGVQPADLRADVLALL